jgi:hypothetical protein
MSEANKSDASYILGHSEAEIFACKRSQSSKVHKTLLEPSTAGIGSEGKVSDSLSQAIYENTPAWPQRPNRSLYELGDGVPNRPLPFYGRGRDREVEGC